MKLLLLLPQLPYPADQGAKMRNLAFLRLLGERHEVHLLCFAHQPPTAEQRAALAPFCRTVETVPPPSRNPIARGIALARSSLPDMAQRLWSPAFAAALRARLARERFDVVHCSNLEMARYLRLVNGPRIVFDDHNAEYVLQQRAFSVEWAAGRALPALYSCLQASRLRRFEAEACQRADRILAVSAADARHLRALAPGRQVHVVPNGIDEHEYPVLPLASSARPCLLFSGKLDYRPNADAVHWFIEAILPLVWARRPDARFLVVGQAPPSWLVRRGQRDSRIAVIGAVPDDRPYLARSSVYVLPMRWGGGTRFKALVALASGRPLVSTTLGIEGLGCRDGQEALVADEPATFADAVLRVLGDEHLARTLAGSGRALIEAHFTWKRISPSLAEVYQGLEESWRGKPVGQAGAGA